MRKNLFICKIAAVTISAACMAGCASKEAQAPQEPSETQEVQETAEPEKTQEEAVEEKLPDAPYLTRGVYVNYSAEVENPPMDYFYVFQNDTDGHTEDGNTGMGLPYRCEQKDGKISFSFGGEDEEWEVFIVKSVENGAVTGYFEDIPERELVFKPMEGEDPDIFRGENYVHAANGEDFVYEDANGWRVRYDPKVIEVNGGGPTVSFVYTGESAGTNMITVSYDVDKDAKTAIEDLAKTYGDKATTSEAPFPGAPDVTGYWADSNSAGEGSGLYMTAFARDFMDGYLLFECTEHKSGDEEMDMAVSDHFATIFDTLEFVPYGDEAPSAASLPAYEYPGSEELYSVLYKYIVDEYSSHYDKADVSIPCVQIIAEDESNKDDILVYGDFWINNYNLNGDVLECVSGGSYCGLVHMKENKDQGGYEVTGMDVVEDGSSYTESAKKIFGKHYDEFAKVSSDSEERDKVRAQIIADYVAANDLDIKAFKDYGWDPVTLPEK